MFTEQHPTMNDYVGVGNNISLAVSSILKVKKAFWTQKKCLDVLTKKIESVQERNCQLEKTNKGLKRKVAKLESDNEKQERIAAESLQERNCQLEKANKGLKRKVAKLESDNEKQEQIVADLIRGGTGVDIFSDVFDVDKNHVFVSGAKSACVNKDIPRVKVNSEHKEQAFCPSSPTTSNKQRSKRKITPKKQTCPRKSRRLSNREQKS